MTDQQRALLAEISASLWKLSSHLGTAKPSNHYLASELCADQSFIISGNTEGLIYLASICVGLAETESQGHYFYCDAASTLSECHKPFILKYELPPWSRDAI